MTVPENMGFGMANKKEYKALYEKLKKEFEIEKNLEMNRKLNERETRNEKKVKRLIETQKGLMRELKLLRERREESVLMSEELEREKIQGLRVQIRSLGDKYEQAKRDGEEHRRDKQRKSEALEMAKSKLIELENQNYDYKHSLEDKDKEINLLRESTRFLETKISKIKTENEGLNAEVESKETLKRELNKMGFEIQKRDEDLRNMKVSLYEVEVNEKILKQKNGEEKQRVRQLQEAVREKEEAQVELQRELKRVNKHREDLDRELRMRKGAGLVEEQRKKLQKEIAQYQEFSKQKDREIENLRTEVDNMKEGRMRIERFYKDKRAEKESLLENEIRDWERDVQRKDQKILDLEFERNICNRELEEKNKEIDRLRADVDKYRKMEEEFLRTVQLLNEEQERESIRSQRTRELDETRDNLIRKLKRRLKNEEIQNNLMQKTIDGINQDVDRLRSEKLKYLDLIKSLKQKLVTKTEPRTKKRSERMFIESDDSIDVGLMKGDQFLANPNPELDSYDQRFLNVDMNKIQSIQSEEFKIRPPGPEQANERFAETRMKPQETKYNLGIAKNKGFMFKSNAASFKGLASALAGDNLGRPTGRSEEVFELKKQLVMKEKKVAQLEEVGLKRNWERKKP